MKLYELMKVTCRDYDCCDNVFDANITCCYIDEEDVSEDYDTFCIKLMKMVDVLHAGAVDCIMICEWYSLFKRNINAIRAYASEVWINEPDEDDDDLVYNWINFMDSCVAGYVGESLYPDLITLLDNFNR